MKTCPNCQAEVESNFNLCWNCNYSFTENQVLEIYEEIPGDRNLDCLRCTTKMKFTGNYKFHEGPKLLLFGELSRNREEFEIYLCPKCGKVEFFSPQK